MPEGWTVVTAPRPQACFVEWNPYPNAVYANGFTHAAYTRDLRVLDWGDGNPPGGHYDASIPGGGQDANSFEEDKAEILDELGDHPGDYDVLLPWLEYMLGGQADLSDPLGNGEQHPDIDFPDRWEKWREHVIERHEFGNEDYASNPEKYWRDAAETVERLRADPDTEDKCLRFDGKEIFWDEDREAIIIVKDGKIDTYFQPGLDEDGDPIDPNKPSRQYFVDECNRTS